MVTLRHVKTAFEHRYGHGGTVKVPAGARVVTGPDGRRWVDHRIFANGIDRHDAEYYGVPVADDNITETHY